ncbi:hypothetical protein G7Y79_00023g053140 [Physcia stellaris]|nr:hypothetical protein G7Y79_00023g053140 [Physcia stellaris]
MFAIVYALLGLGIVDFAVAAALLTLPQVDHTSSFGHYPPVIKDFSTTIEYDRRNPLEEWDLYTLLVQGMGVMSRLPWDSLIESDPFPIRPPGVPLWLTARHPASMGPNRLRIQHLVMGMYEIGCDMVRQQRPFNFYEAYALLALRHEIIAIVTIEKRPATIPVAKDETFSITDYQQPTFRVFGTFTGEDVNRWSVFTALLSALTQIAVHPQDDKRASITAESADSNMRSRVLFSLRDSGIFEEGELFNYGQASRTIVNLWRMFLSEKKYGGLRFNVEFDDKNIGSGSIDGLAAG